MSATATRMAWGSERHGVYVSEDGDYIISRWRGARWLAAHDPSDPDASGQMPSATFATFADAEAAVIAHRSGGATA